MKKRKGFSIIEIVIVIIIVSLIILPITIFFNSTIKGFFAGKPSNLVIGTVNDALREIEELLKGANSLGIIEAQRIGFIVPRNLGGSNVSITIYSNNGYLIKVINNTITKYIPYYNNPNTPNSEKVILLIYFKYYDASFNETTDPNLVEIVEISIKGEAYENPSGTGSYDLNTMVKLRNRWWKEFLD